MNERKLLIWRTFYVLLYNQYPKIHLKTIYNKISGVWVIRPTVLISGPQSPATVRFSTSSTSSYLKSSHYDHEHISFNGLRVIYTMLTYSCYILTLDNSFFIIIIFLALIDNPNNIEINRMIRLVVWQISELCSLDYFHCSCTLIVQFQQASNCSNLTVKGVKLENGVKYVLI